MTEHPELSNEISACIWMIRHYRDLAESCFDRYADLVDAYLVYDHYMIAVAMYEQRFNELIND